MRQAAAEPSSRFSGTSDDLIAGYLRAMCLHVLTNAEAIGHSLQSHLSLPAEVELLMQIQAQRLMDGGGPPRQGSHSEQQTAARTSTNVDRVEPPSAQDGREEQAKASARSMGIWLSGSSGAGMDDDPSSALWTSDDDAEYSADLDPRLLCEFEGDFEAAELLPETVGQTDRSLGLVGSMAELCSVALGTAAHGSR